MINSEVNLILPSLNNCVPGVLAGGDSPARPAINGPTGATLAITEAKIYVPVATLSSQGN